MLAFIQSLLGTYNPVTYTLVDAAGLSQTVVADGLAGVDWTFIFTGVLFCIVVVAFFRILGGVLCRIF